METTQTPRIRASYAIIWTLIALIVVPIVTLFIMAGVGFDYFASIPTAAEQSRRDLEYAAVGVGGLIAMIWCLYVGWCPR